MPTNSPHEIFGDIVKAVRANEPLSPLQVANAKILLASSLGTVALSLGRLASERVVAHEALDVAKAKKANETDPTTAKPITGTKLDAVMDASPERAAINKIDAEVELLKAEKEAVLAYSFALDSFIQASRAEYRAS